jgi:hypothetical protein
MQKQLLLYLVAVLSASTLSASRPTVHASSLRYSNLNCNAVTLKWRNGNGQARIIVAREGALPTYSPQDQTIYMADPLFGASTEYPTSGDGNFIVYNAANDSSVTISNLQAGKSYYFVIYEHDNNNSNTLYLGTGAPDIAISTHKINLSFTIQAIDSCEKTNRFLFTNTTQSTIPGIRYTFNFGMPYDTLTQVTHSFTGGGYKSVKLSTITSVTGCITSLTKNLRIIPRRHVNLDMTKLPDSVQCFGGNYFELSTIPIMQPFPSGITYAWHTGDSQVSHFPKLRKTYSIEGRFRIMLITNMTIYSKPTACFDTLYLPYAVRVLHDPSLNMQVDTVVRYLKGNRFFFSNIDTSVMQQAWHFGDGDSAISDTCSHSYRDTGRYTVKLRIRTNDGCQSEKTLKVRVLADPPATALHAAELAKRMRIYPLPAHAYVNVEFQEAPKGATLQITDLQGRLLLQLSEPESNNRMGLDQLSSGQYLLLYLQDGIVLERVLLPVGQP